MGFNEYEDYDDPDPTVVGGEDIYSSDLDTMFTDIDYRDPGDLLGDILGPPIGGGGTETGPGPGPGGGSGTGPPEVPPDGGGEIYVPPVIFVGALLDVPPEYDDSMNNSMGIGTGQDVLDETTTLTTDYYYRITGVNLSRNLSTLAPQCLNRNQMVTNEFVAPANGWTTVHGAYADASAYGKAPGISIGGHKMTSVYSDPDGSEGAVSAESSVIQYSHLPARKNAAGGRYSSSPAPVADPALNVPMSLNYYSDFKMSQPYGMSGDGYDNAERAAMADKYGYTVTSDGYYPSDTYGAAYIRMLESIEETIAALQAGYSERKNITRSTSRVNIFDNFEEVSEMEMQEVSDSDAFGVSDDTQSVSMGDVMPPTTTGDYS